MRKKVKEETLDKLIENIIVAISKESTLIQRYQIQYEREEENSSGGQFSVLYNPTLFAMKIFVYAGVYKEVPHKGFTGSFLNWLVDKLCHEAGHTYLWELEGRKSDEEKIATLIGRIIYELVRPKIKVPGVRNAKKVHKVRKSRGESKNS